MIAGEPEKPAIIALTHGASLFAPGSIDWEIGNALSAMLKRRRITLEQARAALDVYSQIPLNLVGINLIEAVDLASQLNIFAYDANMVACAASKQCPLLSLDSGLIYAAKVAGVKVLEVARHANLS